MRIDRIIWGVLLLFIGTIFLLENFDIIDFYWSAIWRFWPVLLIILGINFLFNSKNSQTGNIISLGILIVTLSVLFVFGQKEPKTEDKDDFELNMDVDDDPEIDTNTRVNFSAPFLSTDSTKKTILNLTGGGVSFNLNGNTDSLIFATVEKNKSGFALTKLSTDGLNTLSFKMQKNRSRWSGKSNNVNLKLNTFPIWEMNLKMGAGEIDFDLSPYKLRTLNFDGGAASVTLKLGSLLPVTDVNVKTGMADINVEVPTEVGCRIKTKTGLSNKDFNGFIQTSEGFYETPNYKTAAKKILINFDGGLSNFEVNRY